MLGVDPADGIKWYVVFLLSTSCHEAAHAWAAYRLGDDTAHRAGQVTLDPTPHIRREPLGMVLVPLLSYAFAGWMVGWASTPYDPAWAERHPRRAAGMALAGPAGNLLLVFVAAWFMRIGFEWGLFRPGYGAGFLEVVVTTGTADGIWAFCAKLLSLTFALNLLLAAFNLLPVPPLDGSAVPLLFLGPRGAATYQRALRRPHAASVGLVLAWNAFGLVFPSIFHGATMLLRSLFPTA